jgi:hypothetical protein
MLFNIQELPTLNLLILPLLLLGVGLWVRYAWQRLAPKSAILMKATVSVIASNPALLVTQALTFVLRLLGIVYYGACIALMFALDQPILVAAYFAFSGFWLYSTLGYVQLVITAGVTESYSRTGRGECLHNFVKGTFYMLGSAAFCGLLVAFLRTLRWLVEFMKPGNKRKNDDGDDREERSGGSNIARWLLYWVLKEILEFLSQFVQYLAKNTLIYCALFNDSLSGGFDRLKASGLEQQWAKMAQESMISLATFMNSLFIVVIAAGSAGAIGWVRGLAGPSITAMTVGAGIATGILSMNLADVIKDASETLFLCFAMKPELQKRLAPGV